MNNFRKQWESPHKFVVLKVILLISLFVLSIGIITASSTDFFLTIGKETSCNLLNVTGTFCDDVWCEIISTDELPCSNNATLQSCVCTSTINGTIIIGNDTFQDRDELLAIIDSMNLTIANADFVAKNYTDSEILALRNSLMDKMDNNSVLYLNMRQGAETPQKDWTLTFIIICIVLIIVIWVVTNKIKAKTQIPARSETNVLRKIPRKEEMEQPAKPTKKKKPRPLAEEGDEE